MSDVILVGDVPADLVAALEAAGLGVARLDGGAVGADLDAAGVDAAGVLLLTDAGQATLVPVARERNSDIAIVLYGDEGFPDFASAQADLAVDRSLVEAPELVDALVDRVRAAG
ncbi:MAG: CTP synthetase [Halobacteriales archaeon]